LVFENTMRSQRKKMDDPGIDLARSLYRNLRCAVESSIGKSGKGIGSARAAARVINVIFK